MKKDLPSIYKNNVTKKNTHNKNVFYVKNDDENNRQVEGLEAVSYTHLDVYKRQVLLLLF